MATKWYIAKNGKIEVGDTVTWLPSSKGHNVEMISSPNKMKFKSKNGKEAKITFDTPGIYYYLCTPHKGMGMIGLVVVGNDMSNIDDVKKAKAYGKSKKKLKKLLASLNRQRVNTQNRGSVFLAEVAIEKLNQNPLTTRFRNGDKNGIFYCSMNGPTSRSRWQPAYEPVLT